MKKITIRIMIIIGILLIILKGVEWWLEHNFNSRINSNPDRAYNIEYDDFDLHTFLNGITLDKVRIRPFKESNSGSVITGDVDYATLNGLVWTELLFGKTLSIDEISFEQPVFEITLKADTVSRSNKSGIQDMFGDILSRVDLQNFRIQNGSLILKEAATDKIKGQVNKVNIEAYELETDSVKIRHLIPFKLGSLVVEMDDFKFDLNEYTHFSLGSVRYDLKEKEIRLKDISMGYSIDWVAVSQKIGIQNDVIELSVKEISINELEPSDSFYSYLDIVAEKISIKELNIQLQRNKNLPRPPDKVKPMFNGMISAIPVPLELDSIQITDSKLTYRELGANKDESGFVSLENINGVIKGLTNSPQKQKSIRELKTHLTANLNGFASMNIDLSIPYHKEAFSLSVEMGRLELNKLNPMLSPLAGVDISSGELKRLNYKMNASSHLSENNLIFDYSNLHLVLMKEQENHKFKKRGIITSIANTFVKNDNFPGHHIYLTASYQSERNIYRSPVNYIIHGLVEGIERIVPGKNLGNIITKDRDKKKKSSK